VKPGTISAIVTGASGGIGSEICRRLAARGARVLLIGRNASSLGTLAKALADMPAPSRGVGATLRGVPAEDDDRSRIDVLAVDLRLSEARLAVRDASRARHVNVLVNCAGIASFGPIESIDDDQLDDVIATNLTAPIALTRLLLPTLRATTEASILNIGSVLGGIGMPGFTAYAASKAGLHAFTEALRRELAGSPVRVQFLGARATRTAFNNARVEAFNRVTGAHSDPPQVVADAAVSLLMSGRNERYLGAAERFLVRLNAVGPGLLDPAFRRHRLALAQSPGTPTPSSSQDMPLP
jgi:short-subunit dehydrogenase